MHCTIIDPMDIYTTSKSCKLEVNSPKNIRCLIQWINKTIIQTFKRSEKVVNWLNLLVLISSLSVYSALASCSAQASFSAEAYFSAQVFFSSAGASFLASPTHHLHGSASSS